MRGARGRTGVHVVFEGVSRCRAMASQPHDHIVRHLQHLTLREGVRVEKPSDGSSIPRECDTQSAEGDTQPRHIARLSHRPMGVLCPHGMTLGACSTPSYRGRAVRGQTRATTPRGATLRVLCVAWVGRMLGDGASQTTEGGIFHEAQALCTRPRCRDRCPCCVRPHRRLPGALMVLRTHPSPGGQLGIGAKTVDVCRLLPASPGGLLVIAICEDGTLVREIRRL